MANGRWNVSLRKLRGSIERRLPVLLKTMLERYQKNRVSGLAAEIAFFAVLSLFPGILAMVAVLGFLDNLIGSRLAAASQDAVIGFLEQVLTRQAAGTIDAVQALFENESQGLFSLAVIGSIFAMSRGTSAAMRALSAASEISIKHSWIYAKLKALALAAGTILILLVMLLVLVIGPLLGVGRALTGLFRTPDQVGFWFAVLRYPVAFMVLVAWALALLHFGPDHRSYWRKDVPGALLTSVLWLLASLGLRLYLEAASSFNQVFGVLGGAIILMIWFYLLSLALLLGGELNAARTQRKSRPQQG